MDELDVNDETLMKAATKVLGFPPTLAAIGNISSDVAERVHPLAGITWTEPDDEQEPGEGTRERTVTGEGAHEHDVVGARDRAIANLERAVANIRLARSG